VPIGRGAEHLRELAGDDGVAVASAHVRDRVEAEVFLGEVRDQVRGRVRQRAQVALEIRRALALALDRELAARDQPPAAGREAHQAGVREVEEVAGHRVRT
jgi:hypothetical protein